MPRRYETTAIYLTNKNGMEIFRIEQGLFDQLEDIATRIGDEIYRPFWKKDGYPEKVDIAEDLKDLFNEDKYFLKAFCRPNFNLDLERGKKYKLVLEISYYKNSRSQGLSAKLADVKQ